MSETGSLLPAWMVVPPAMVLVIAVASHLLAMRESEMPESRRRLRVANGVMMLITVPLTAYAFCRVSPQDPRFFVLTWTGVLGLVGIVVSLAVADILNNLYLSYRSTRALRSQIKALQLALIEHARAKASDAQSHPHPHHPHS